MFLAFRAFFVWKSGVLGSFSDRNVKKYIKKAFLEALIMFNYPLFGY